MLKCILLTAGLAIVLMSAAALAAGCPPGTKRHCVQTKSGVQCYCR
jgi:hypothetical protein